MRNKPKTNKKNIVILGAGFCGLQAAKRLAKRLRFNREHQIILADRRDVSIYNGDLYEISSAYNKRISNECLSQLRESVSIPIKRVLRGLEVYFIRDNIASIDPAEKKVVFKNKGEISYEYLVLALGSVTNYYDIPGLEEHSFPLKTVEDAMALNCHFDQFFRERWEKKNRGRVSVVVGGGGFTGVEYACELAGCVKKLARKYHFDPAEVSISIVQGSGEFVGLGKKVSDLAYRRFRKLGIHPITNTRIAGYDGKVLTVCSKTGVCKRSMRADILVWTGGVKPNPLVKYFPILDPSGALEVRQNLESPHYPHVYAGGDNAAVFDPVHRELLPKLAQLAVQQGSLIGHNVWADIAGRPQKTYKAHFKGFIVPMGGRYFVFHKDSVTFSGLIPYLMRRFVDLWYFMRLLPPSHAFKKWIHTQNIFLQND